MKRNSATKDENNRLDIINVKLKMYDLYPDAKAWFTETPKGARRPFRMILPDRRLFFFENIELLETYFGRFLNQHTNSNI